MLETEPLVSEPMLAPCPCSSSESVTSTFFVGMPPQLSCVVVLPLCQ